MWEEGAKLSGGGVRCSRRGHYTSIGATGPGVFNMPEEAQAAEEAANSGPQKKEAPEVEKFITTYYEFPGSFTTNLRGSRKFLQAGIGVSTQYDENVITNVEDHQLSLRSSILAVMSEFSEQDIEGKSGRDALAKAIAAELNTKLETLEGFGGIENVYFTSFMLQ